MLLVGYFEGLDSERGIEWRCADSLSLRKFLLLSSRETVPDHAWLSKTRSRLPLEIHDAVFVLVLEQMVNHGLIKGDRIGVPASTMEANAALRAIVTAPIHSADEGDTKTLRATFKATKGNLDAVGQAPSEDDQIEVGDEPA